MNTKIKERIVQIQNGDIPEGYKMSKLGIIPADWEIVKLGKIAKIYDGTHQTPRYTSEGVKFVSVEDINDIVSSKKYISKDDFDEFKIKPHKNDILMTRITAGEIGATAIIKTGEPLGYYVSLALIRCLDNINTRYIDYFINCALFKRELHKRIIHTAFPKKINLGDISKCLSVLPAILEQQKIAAILSTQDKVIELKEQLLSEKNRQKQYLMQVLLNPDSPHFKRLPGFSGDWDKVKLGTVIEEIRETSTENNQYTMLTSSQNGLLLQRDYFKKSVASEENIGYKIIRAGDFTFRSMSDTGFFKINRLKKTEVGIVSPAYSVFSVIKANKDFMEFLFDSHRMTFNYSRIAQGGTRLALKLSALKRLSILLPKEDEQTKIADLLLNIASEIELFKQEIGQQKQKKKALMQLLLMGKVRVRV